ncbi:MAG TPA: CBS domain-containing protein [Chloroflexi bacterium]|nr:CBS domain-containing protein [Chloroflexota bacterium]
MDLIVTHDNADFDALASQLGAYKLMPGAKPVLPNRLNRNVRHFVALYQDELPFVRARDLPREPVGRLIVVDTPHVQTVRGMSDETAVTIIDHHTPRDPYNPDWQVTVEAVGATTTLLCEQIKERHIPLTPIEATLLVLGIYEDTGSLTYVTTTPRDAYAAAWLLECGALLDVVRDFLHHPLADDQRALYNRLLENARTYEIEGYPIVIASASAPDLVEEIATLAHKLRDLLDPAALFVLVNLGPHIQMVARSTVDEIDVGQIAAYFGGGGHSRAAASIIREATLAEAEKKLLAILPRFIRPSLTVADLMSYGVQTLPAHARARDAALQMRRYGYEGFPIVKDGRIIGLLTRRAVDRALDHGLDGVRVDQLMEAGEVFVRPDDSIATLQQTMMTSGWGQVPVVDEEGHIIGVVTRTDLIKHMGHDQPATTRRDEIVRRLEDALPPLLMTLIREIGRIAHEMGLNLYAVGGFVRDLLLGQPTIDIDFVVEGDAIALTRALRETFGGDIRYHVRFGTGKWLIDAKTWGRIAARLDVPEEAPDRLPAHLDFATARTEFYEAPTALPEVERGSIKLDLHRRDFTINTLAIRLDPAAFGQLLDFYGGEADLREKRIRVLHSLSFVDDPTRILRAVRLEQRLGFHIEPRTEELIGHALPLLDRVSGDRIRHEIELILLEQAPERALCRLDRLGVLRTLHPDLRCDEWVKAAFRALRAARRAPLWPEIGAGFDPSVSYFALLTYRLSPEAQETVCARLKVRRRTREALNRLQAIRARMDELSRPLPPSQVDAILYKTGDAVLLAAWAAAPTATARDQIADYARRLRWIRPLTDGEALKARGLRPGPHFGRILDRLRAAWLDGEVTTPEEEEALLKQLLAEEIS